MSARPGSLMQARVRPNTALTPEDEWLGDEAKSLPAWIYSDPDYFEAEQQAVFRPSWQIVCHESDIPNAGDYQTLDFLGELIAVVRGDDGRVRAFHNVCRHRGSRLLDGAHGNCGARINCPYHAWSYDLT